jgi:predicted ATPase
MEKLIVKNFGPIKEAKIDLTKYVVFIGDTSTGKSVLAKLISIFRDSVFKLSFQDGIESIDFKTELKKYNINFDFSKSEIYYTSIDITLETDILISKLIAGKIVFSKNDYKKAFSKEIQKITEKILDDLEKSNFSKIDKNKVLQFVQNEIVKKTEAIYFPAERNLYSLTGNSLAGLMANNVSLPDCYKDFAALYEVARKEINEFNFKDFGLKYNFKNNLDLIEFNNNEILLSESSSGIQSLIPLLLVFENGVDKNTSTDTDMNTIVLEEPELNLFPIKQKLLINHVIKKINKTINSLIITTHSPYILSSLDTLMLAKNTFNEHPDLKEEINAIVPESNWIDYNDISVYEVRNDGKLYSIKNEEFKSIDTNAIDGVSDIISEEFDKLTELRYAH